MWNVGRGTWDVGCDVSMRVTEQAWITRKEGLTSLQVHPFPSQKDRSIEEGHHSFRRKILLRHETHLCRRILQRQKVLTLVAGTKFDRSL